MINVFAAVSSSLKRESNFTSEIQRLRLENEKLRKQAEASSRQLKKQSPQVEEDNETKVESKEPSLCSTAVSENSSCLKRKASSQLSPPPTPDAMRAKKPMIATTQPLKKKKLVKQTKAFVTQPIQSLDISPLLESSWSPANHTPPTYFDVTSASPTYTNTITSPLSLFANTTTGSDLYPQALSTQPQFQNMMHPMLFAPYYMPSEVVTASPDDCK
jgi:hypothetical protein